MNSSARVEGTVGSPLLHCSCGIASVNPTLLSGAHTKDEHHCGTRGVIRYLGPRQLLQNVLIVWLHVACKFQIADSVLVTAVNTLGTQRGGEKTIKKKPHRDFDSTRK